MIPRGWARRILPNPGHPFLSSILTAECKLLPYSDQRSAVSHEPYALSLSGYELQETCLQSRRLIVDGYRKPPGPGGSTRLQYPSRFMGTIATIHQGWNRSEYAIRQSALSLADTSSLVLTEGSNRSNTTIPRLWARSLIMRSMYAQPIALLLMFGPIHR